MSTGAITDRRKLTTEHYNGSVEWRVMEFDGGDAYILIAEAASTQFSAHFSGEQWAKFQALIARTKQ